MELWEQIKQNIEQSIEEESITKPFELRCYVALNKIKSILEDDSLSDKDCFWKIEEIISVYEKMGVCVNFRHDY